MTRSRNFHKAKEPIEIGLGGETFTAPPVIPAPVLAELLGAGDRIADTQNAEGVTGQEKLEQVIKVIDEVFGLVLVPESAERFHERLYSRTNPLDLMGEVMPALTWLVEEAADRPTEPSQPSSNGSGGGGTTSTAGAPNGASTLSTFPHTASPTSPIGLSTS